MPLPAGTGLDRRAFLVRSAGLFLSVYGGSKLGFRPSRRAARRPRTRRAACSCRSSSRAAPTRCRSSSPTATRSTRISARRSRSGRRGHALLGGQPAPLASGCDRSRRSTPRARSRRSRRSATRTRISPTSRLGTTGRSALRARASGRAGSAGTSTASATADNPLQGLSLDWSLQPSLATGRVPVATLESPDGYDFWARDVWGEVEDGMLPRSDRWAPPTQSSTEPRFAPRARSRSSPTGSAGSSAASTRRRARCPAGDGNGFPSAWLALAAMIDAGLPLECVALQAPGAYDTHDNQVVELEAGLSVTAATLLAFQRDLEARGLADRVVHVVWSEFGRGRGGERLGHRPRRGRARVRDRLAGSRRDDRRVPGLGTGLDTEGNLRPTADYRALYCSLLEQWRGDGAAGRRAGARTRGSRRRGDRQPRRRQPQRCGPARAHGGKGGRRTLPTHTARPARRAPRPRTARGRRRRRAARDARPPRPFPAAPARRAHPPLPSRCPTTWR